MSIVLSEQMRLWERNVAKEENLMRVIYIISSIFSKSQFLATSFNSLFYYEYLVGNVANYSQNPHYHKKK